MANDLATELQQLLGARYVIERELGKGGMSRLFVAREPMLDSRRVVVKTLPPELMSRVSRSRFLNEIAVMSRLQHPRILPILTGDFHEWLAYYITPYIEGESLRERLTRDGSVAPTEVITLLSEIADAVGYGHAQGFVHRDIKPENVLLSPGGAVVADFGIARALRPTPDQLRPTTGEIGTRGYIPPEAEPDERGDVFALGVVGTELLTGERFSAGARAAVVVSKWEALHAGASRRGDRNVVRPLARVLERALAVDPEQRQRTAGEFGDAIRTVLAESRPAVRWRRNAIRGAAAASALVAVGVGASRVARDTSSKLVPNLLAVAPFQVTDSALTIWREGVTDALWRTLDGAGPVRVLSPTITIRRWYAHPDLQRADLESAVALGEATKARFVLVGSIAMTGGGVRIRATLFDIAKRTKVNEFEESGPIASLANAVDRLSLAIVADRRFAGPAAAVHVVLDTLTNLTALKFFLQAEEAYRNNQLDSARAASMRAIREDPNFALPYYRIRTVLRATRGENDNEASDYALLADARNHRLGRHDSLLIAGVSWAVKVRRSPPRSRDWWRANTNRFVALEQLVSAYPEDAEAWYELGEIREHSWSWTGVSSQSALDAFEKAIGNDSAFAPAYYHAVELRALLNGGADAAAIARRYPVTHSVAVHDSAAQDRLAVMELVSQLAVADSSSAQRLCGGRGGVTAFNHRAGAAYLLRLMPDPNEVSLHCYRGIASSFDTLWAADSQGVRSDEVETRVARGHMRHAAALALPRLAVASRLVFQQLAMLGALPDSVVLRDLQTWRDGADPLYRMLAIPVYRARHDSASLARLADAPPVRLRERSSADSLLAGYIENAARGSLALLAHDTTRALAAFETTSDSICGWFCTSDRLLVAIILARHGEGARAGRILDRWPPPAELSSAMAPIWHLVRGALFEQAGPAFVSQASAHYARTAAAWQFGDDLVRGCFEAARLGVLRTGSGSGANMGALSHLPDVASLACSSSGRQIAAAR